MLGLFAGKDEKSTMIGSAPLFSHCSKQEMKILASEMDQVDVASGHVLIREGRQSDSFYVIASGSAEVTVEGKTRAKLGPGDFFGEISMIERRPASATVTATTDTRLLVMGRQQFRDAVRSRDDIAVQVIQAMAERLRQNAEADVVEESSL
jgi:CRP-like cAMP-binding protein